MSWPSPSPPLLAHCADVGARPITGALFGPMGAPLIRPNSRYSSRCATGSSRECGHRARAQPPTLMRPAAPGNLPHPQVIERADISRVLRDRRLSTPDPALPVDHWPTMRCCRAPRSVRPWQSVRRRAEFNRHRRWSRPSRSSRPWKPSRPSRPKSPIETKSPIEIKSPHRDQVAYRDQVAHRDQVKEEGQAGKRHGSPLSPRQRAPRPPAPGQLNAGAVDLS